VATFTLDQTGSVSAGTHVLAGGAYQLNAHYAGDGTFAPSDSAPPVWVTVQAEPSITTLSILSKDPTGTMVPFTGGPYGTSVYLRAHVSGQSGYGTPSNWVNFYEGQSSVAAQVWLDKQGNANAPPLSQFSGGVHSISGGYYGDSSFNTSVSPLSSFTVTQASTTSSVMLQGSDNTGTIIVVTVDTNSGGNSPTGTVSFLAGGAPLGTPVTVTGGVNGSTGKAQAIAFITSPISGNLTLTATYSGDVNYAGSTTAPLAVSPDFVLWSNAGAGVVFNSRGSSSGTTLSVSSTDSFSGTVAFTCSGLPAESTCSFSPASLPIGPNAQAVNTTIAIKTTAPAIGQLSPNHLQHKLWWPTAGWLVMAGVFVSRGPKRFNDRNSRTRGLVVLAFLISSVGCGGGGGNGGGKSDSGTPIGSYKITVTAASGSISHAASFQLVVQ
jgi:hypothetical protein